MTSPDVEQQATEEVQSLTGLIAIVTGGSDGIGYETTFRLAMQGARVYIMSRSTQKASDAITSMKVAASGTELDLHFLRLDLQDLASVTKAAEGCRGLHRKGEPSSHSCQQCRRKSTTIKKSAYLLISSSVW